jgi:hypothetical protein
MKKFFLALLFMPVFAGAQKIPSPAKFAKTITAEDLKTQLYIVAGADMQGRETATEGQHKAAAYIESQFKSLGLLPGNNGSYQQHYPVFQDSLINAAITVNGQNFETEKDFVVNTSSNYTATLMGGEVVFVGYGLMDSTRNDYKDIDANGKIVLILAGTPPSAKAPTRRSRFNNAIQEAAMQNGAVAVLIVQEGFPRRAMNSRGNMTMNGYKKTIYPNTFYISEQVAEKIMGADFAAAKETM